MPLGPCLVHGLSVLKHHRLAHWTLVRDGMCGIVLLLVMTRLCSSAFMPDGCAFAQSHLGYLVDPASSHMLVSKIKPCMSKYKRLYCETANGSLNQLWFI